MMPQLMRQRLPERLFPVEVRIPRSEAPESAPVQHYVTADTASASQELLGADVEVLSQPVDVLEAGLLVLVLERRDRLQPTQELGRDLIGVLSDGPSELSECHA